MDMKKIAVLLVLTLLFVALAVPASAGNGNLSPTGPHYNLNLIGVNDKSAPMDGNNGHRIFVKLWGTSKIWLKEGYPFQVLDANATDADGGKFQLPNPDPDGDGKTWYSVWARALGKPGGQSTTHTCAYDDNGVEWCNMVYPMVLVRGYGQSKFDNVTKSLLFIYADLDLDGKNERYPLFDDALEDYFWKYQNSGLKLAQLRFYEIETEVPAP
jgi:hypothetical protein